MENTHNNEIISTRKGGFGGSDAAMFLRIAKASSVDALSATDNRRIAVMMGLAEPRQFTTTAMEAGHAFEDWYESQITEPYQREQFMEIFGMAKHFKLFAHADYLTSKGRVYELKYSQEDTIDVQNRYMAQCQWYYMLGAKSVVLVHGWGLVEPFIVEGTHYSHVPQIDHIIADLKAGITILDEAIDGGWKPSNYDSVEFADLTPEVAGLLVSISTHSAQVKELTEQLDAEKAKLMEYMDAEGLSSINAEFGKMSYTQPTKTMSLDTKRLQAEMPELCRDFMKEGVKKGYVTFKPVKQK